MLVIGRPDKSNLINEINHISEKIKVAMFTQQEWSLMARKDPVFYERVEKDKVKL